MAYTTKTTTSYGTRVSNAFGQIKMSFSLFLAVAGVLVVLLAYFGRFRKKEESGKWKEEC